MRRERLVLTLPADPAFARLTRLTALHFLRQHGVGAVEALKDARRIETRARAALRAAGHAEGRRLVALTCTCDPAMIEILLSRSKSGSTRLLHLARHGSAP